MKLTKRNEGGSWLVYLDGEPTAITIVKGLPAKFGNPQMWDVCDAEDFLFEAKSLSVAMATLERTIRALGLDTAERKRREAGQ